jgi:AraC-like DNA-binding protein
MGQLAEDVNMSQKHLERLFQRYVGHTPKTYARIARFQGALGSMTLSQGMDAVDLVSRFGYFDQAHLINDFKQFTGVTPGQYQAAQYSVIQTYL